MEDIACIRREHGLDLNTTDEQARRALESLRTNLSNSLKNLSEELYTKDLHFVLEFIQNADDNSYARGVTPTLGLRLNNSLGLITIRCNEVGFTSQNVRAICSVGRSTKQNIQGYIGEKGIGFKAVFSVASIVYILSGKYSFKFDNSGPGELGMIAPIWTTEHPVQRGWTTFHLVIRPSVDLSNLSRKLAEVEPTLLLFLRKLRQLDVVINGQLRHLSRTDMPNGITVLTSGAETRRYITVKHVATNLPFDAKRLNVDESEVVLAFPVSSTGEPIINDQNVHTFLPLRSFGFSFIIQADFLTTSNREDIISNRPWNSALRDAIPIAFHRALQKFHGRAELTYNWLQYIPRHVPNDFMMPIITGIKERIQLRGENGDLHPPNGLLIVPQEYQTESSEPLIPERHMGSSRYLDSGYNTSRDAAVLNYLGVKTMTPDNFISGLESMGHEVRKNDNAWFDRTCSALRSLANQWRSSYKGRIRNLCLVPLEGGSWVTACASDIFFVDTSLSDVPEDLPLRFVRRYPPLPQEHRRLLEDLGVKVASSSEIASQILSLHRQYGSTPGTTTVLSHAKFIFHYTPSSSASLKVRCRDGSVRDGTDVYMDYPFAQAKLPLSEILEPYGAPFLHHDYYVAFHGTLDAQRWFQWLRDVLCICISPYFDGYRFCSEFRNFVAHPRASTQVLRTLRDYWPLLQPELQQSEAAMKELSAIQVMCSDTQRHRLDETYLGRSNLRRRFPDLLFANVEDVESSDWNFLTSLGVTFDVGGMFYLKRLIERSREKRPVTLEEVLDLYGQISARFDDEGNECRIRQAFQDNAIIYIPPPTRNAQGAPDTLGLWLSSKDVFWNGPHSVFSKIILTSFSHYDPLRKFFFEQLRIPSCPDDILLSELRIVEKKFQGRPLTSEEHRLVFNLLEDVSLSIPSGRTTKEEKPQVVHWVANLKTLGVFPGTAPTKDVCLYKPAQLYNPLGSGHLYDLFSGKVPMLVAPNEEKLGRLHALLSSAACDDMKTLYDEVRRDILHHDASGLRVDVPLSERYLSRLEALKRLVLWKPRSSSSIVKLTDLIVYKVDKLSCRYTIGDFAIDTEPQALVLSIDQEGSRLVVWQGTNGQDAKDRDDDFEFAIAFGHEWKIDFEAVHMVLLLQEKYLAMHEVPDLASLIDPLNRPSSKWSSDAQASSLAIDTLKIESASQHPEPRPPATSRISQAQAEARPQPSFEVEWNTRIIEYDAELRNIVRLEDLNLGHLDGQFANLSIHPSSFPDNTNTSMYYTGSQEAGSSVDLKVHLESAFPESPSPEPFTFNARSYRKASSGSRGHRTTGAMPNSVGEEFTTGALGELYIFYLLSKKLPQFTAENWTSEMRYHASACKLDRFTGDSTADFYYEDAAGVLTKLLLGEESSLTKKWSTRYPRYHLEVKATTGNQYTPFHLSRKQLETASKMTIRDLNAVPEDVYVLIRVWNVRTNDLQQVQYQAYLDPHRLLYNGKLRIESEDGVSVVIRE